MPSIKSDYLIYAVFVFLLLTLGLIASGCTPNDSPACSTAENPCCYPDECDLDDGTIGRCGMGGDFKACHCQQVKQSYSVCGPPANLSCDADACTTTTGEAGQCGYDASDCCVCAEEEEPPPGPCSEEENPCCYPETCERPNGLKGRCLPDAAADACVCRPPQEDYSVCGPPDNLACDATDCTTETGAAGLCAWDDSDCCFCEKEEPVDPCSEEENYCCYPETCELPGGHKGRCLPDADLGDCICQEPQEDYSACGLPDNMSCDATDCKTETGEAGLCAWDSTDCCYCESDAPVDPCSKEENPCCYPDDCELATGGEGRCLPDPAADACLCQKIQDDYSVCGPPDNMSCEAIDCKTETGEGGRCAWDSSDCCVCESDIIVDGDWDSSDGDWDVSDGDWDFSDGDDDPEEEVPVDPCSEEENLCCYPKLCDLTPGVAGRCLPDSISLLCRCQPIQQDYSACTTQNNLACETINCKTDLNEAGLCIVDSDLCCVCVADDPIDGDLIDGDMTDGDLTDGDHETEQENPPDPCSEEENRCCYPEECDLATGGMGRCLPDADLGKCLCQKIQQEYSTCGAPDNPVCETIDCKTDTGASGLCAWDNTDCCICKGFVIDGDFIDGDFIDGDLIDGDLIDGDLIDGDLSDGDLIDGDFIDGDLTDGDLLDGDLVDGDHETEQENPPDPCSEEENRCCYPEDCHLPTGEMGRCLPEPDLGKCLCQQLQDVYSTCGPPTNPVCETINCKTATGAVGQCTFDNTDCCICKSDVIDGDVIDGDVIDGDMIDGDMIDGDMIDGDLIDGDLIDGDLIDGDEDPDVEHPGNPCSEEENRCCLPDECDLPTGELGRCVSDPTVGLCLCMPVQPSYDTCTQNNPVCEAISCKDVLNQAGHCIQDGNQCCVCLPDLIDGDTEPEEEIPGDPCSTEENRCCYPEECPLPTGELGRCLPEPDQGKCLCQPQQDTYSTCGPPDNPVCETIDCTTEQNTPGRCLLDIQECCACKENPPAD